ncbi:cytochrome C [Azospirillum argentinense]|uniref:Cytochrome C n=1 Tax=Azospirillum argentinense TaxID=2970906 RepID=A0A060DN20_9PROT|nr:c-type cytochrome [Azospirillum argentinense]AIB12438.1 cytochrome C [Azospirillum argentinense]EZQ09260.1 cytochrome C [Azospirillum argentinense]
MALHRRTLYRLTGGAALLGVLGFVVLTSPWTWSATHPGRTLPDEGGADLANGRKVFVASDCATCHKTPGQEDDTVLGGGWALDTQFGVFHMPNISPDPETGIGGWTLAQFDRALREGVGPGGAWPDGRNLYPAFPYTSYQRLSGTDVRDLYAYLLSLKPVGNKVPDHDLKFPYAMRRGVGVWRLAFLDGKRGEEGPVPAGVDAAQYRRGEYLVEGPGHCAECHSSRGLMGNVIASQRYGGGKSPDGVDYFPNISPDETGIGFWSVNAIANYLHTGVSPIGRTAAGDMAEVVKNTAQLPREDLLAMAVYLKHVPAVHKPAPGMPEPNRTDTLVMLRNAVAAAPTLPTTPEQAIAQGGDVWVVATKPVWLEQAAVGGAVPEQGKLLGGAPVHVAARNADKLELVLKGWQMAEAPSVVYQSKGHRVMLAVLDQAAAAAVKRGKPETDADTGQSWVPVEVTLWSDAVNLNADRKALWDYSQATYQKACSACHVLPDKQHFTANQWVGTLKAMKRFTSFNDDQYRLILTYLQNHSKDLRPNGKEAAK